ncbi:MAG: hypothetical protein A3I66_03920 [Burkholderiales bacterium RIFCSPLOWO2_02_FULL_57_36]|nr:MAG: hypothetical protein A3I66_03920 [Burkholderiales bacterium RIFCSPLOWO2_02_FULL_57_36]
MHRAYNNALVLIRFFGLVGIIFGLMWFANVAAASLLSAVRAPEWLRLALWEGIVQQQLSGPIWFIAGLIILKNSEELTEFLVKATKQDGD